MPCLIKTFLQERREKPNLILANIVNYCKSTSIHGFAYWVSAENILEKLFWVLVVVSGFTSAIAIVSSAVQGWIDEPGVTEIKTFSKVVYTMDEYTTNDCSLSHFMS